MREKWINILEKIYRLNKSKKCNVCGISMYCDVNFDADYKIQLLNFVVGVFCLSKNTLIIKCRSPPTNQFENNKLIGGK